VIIPTVFLIFVSTVMVTSGIISSNAFALIKEWTPACSKIFNDSPLEFSCCKTDTSKPEGDSGRYYDCLTCKITEENPEGICEETNDKPMKALEGTVSPDIGGGQVKGDISDSKPGQNVTSGNFSQAIGVVPGFGMNFTKAQAPDTVHLRIQIDSIEVFHDRDTQGRGDGEWLLQGVVTCCGSAANSNMPTKAFSFNAPGVVEGQIDTPDDRMNDVTGEYSGMWGTREIVEFKDVYQDIDVDNNNPITELRINFFGIEDDSLTKTELPPIPDSVGDPEVDAYLKAANYAEDLIVYLNGLKSVDHLGNIRDVFTKANNYGVGLHYAWPDHIYENKSYKTENAWKFCPSQDISGYDCTLKDWPDFPEYQLNYRIIDKDGPRCDAGFTYSYAKNTCDPDVIS